MIGGRSWVIRPDVPADDLARLERALHLAAEHFVDLPRGNEVVGTLYARVVTRQRLARAQRVRLPILTLSMHAPFGRGTRPFRTPLRWSVGDTNRPYRAPMVRAERCRFMLGLTYSAYIGPVKRLRARRAVRRGDGHPLTPR